MNPALLLLMTSAILLASVEDALKPLIVAERGLVSVAETDEDAIEELANAPDRWRVVLSMDGDKPLDELNPSGAVIGTLVAYVQAPKGFEQQPARTLHRDAVKGTPAFFTRLHWVIRKIRGLSIVATDVDANSFRYQGWDWLKFEGQSLFRTAKARFDIVFAHDDPAEDPEGTAPVVLPSPFRIVAAADEFYTISLHGTAHGRVPRFAAGLDDPTGTATGYAITGTADEFYAVACDGVPHGRIPRFLA